ATSSAVDLAELEKFLINFVVEQTGYPPEVVELDADLEADLGIDSIKKAQMFGELQEYFDVTPTDDMTLDDFPTLRHIVEFLAKATTVACASFMCNATAAPAPAPVVPHPARALSPLVIAAPSSPPPPNSFPSAGSTERAARSTVDLAELEKFLINFV